MSNEAYKRLSKLYRKYTGTTASPKSQMCMFWSVDDPPDVLQCTESLEAILDEFNIDLNEDESVELYDMSLQEASAFLQRKSEKCNS